uniref:Uncharacterized protein n=1 Tax=Picea glauca TaxID=3330 RepID=A0A124GME5_PICGL|nr:hypothetical protein ABT39_MTgene2693 [Picea glauca]QHR87250.1 hypothetical protein Q903MT_gene1259 [Picea sitchensis]
MSQIRYIPSRASSGPSRISLIQRLHFLRHFLSLSNARGGRLAFFSFSDLLL